MGILSIYTWVGFMNRNAKLLTKQYKFYRRLTFILLITSQIVFGILDVIFYYKKGFLFFSFLVSVFTYLILVPLWCKFDSSVQKRRFRSTEGFSIIVIGIIGIPAYFWRTRTRKEFFISLGGLFLYIIPATTYYLAWLLTVKVLQLVGYYAS